MRVGDCKHYTGLREDSCGAGVWYEDLQFGRTGEHRRLPCLPSLLGTGSAAWVKQPIARCSRFEPLTQAEHEVEQARLDAACERFAEAFGKGLSTCCNAALINKSAGRSEWWYCSACKSLVMHGHR